MTIRRGPLIAFVMLLLIAAHAAWDYVETWRYRERFTAILAAGEPVQGSLTMPLPAAPPAGRAAESDRYYRAAAALISGTMRGAVLAPIVLGPQDYGYREALDLVDRAADLPFDGFTPGTTYSTLTSALMALSQLCEARSVSLVTTPGSGDSAFDSLRSDVKLSRAMQVAPRFTSLGFVISHGVPSPAARARLAEALAEIDRDDRLAGGLIRARAAMLSDPSIRLGYLSDYLLRPWHSRDLSARLDTFAGMIAAARQPWPARIQAVNAFAAWPPAMFWHAEQTKSIVFGFTRSIAEQTRRIRCARLLVLPPANRLVDPLTGQSLEASSCHL